MIQTDNIFLDLTELLQQASSRTFAALMPANNRFRLTSLQSGVLAAVQHNPGCTMGELSHVLSMVPPAVTRLVDGLVREGLVERFAKSTDRRVVMVQLTVRGHYIADNIQREVSGYLSKVLTMMSVEEIEALQNGLEKFSSAIFALNQRK
jgi:DNA-binding MarR family transcriptional regulator